MSVAEAPNFEGDWVNWDVAKKAELRWRLQARPEQLAPDGDWSILLWLAGRGWGKTRALAEWCRLKALEAPNRRLAVVAPTYSDGRDTVAEGASGLLRVIPSALIEGWNRSLGDLRLKNGSLIRIFSADVPERLRGPQFHFAVCDELAAWHDISSWDMLLFGLRLGEHPQVVVATTPQPSRLLTELVRRAEGGDQSVRVVRGHTLDNRDNLSPIAVQRLLERYEGTRLGRQELAGELLSEHEGALWSAHDIEDSRIRTSWSTPKGDDGFDLGALSRIVVAYDPAVSRPDDSDRDQTAVRSPSRTRKGDQRQGRDTRLRDERWSESGLVVVGRDDAMPSHVYVLEDASARRSAEEMARLALECAIRWSASRIVIERNNGGDWVPALFRQIPGADEYPIKTVWASRGKAVRAEPVAALWEQGRAHMVGAHPYLEQQMVEWVPQATHGARTGRSDRVDALVWGVWDLVIGPGGPDLNALLTSPGGPTGPSYWRGSGT